MNIDRLKSPKFLIPAVAAGALLLSASSCDEKGLGDAPIGDQHETEREIWVNADKFPNISAFCIGNSGVYTTTREAAPVIIADDSNCLPGGVLFSEKND
jgi:hypothetical protein